MYLTLVAISVIVSVERGYVMTGKEIYKKLIGLGWMEVLSKGSHRKLRKGSKMVIVPYHTTELAKKTEHSIKKIANIK